MRRIFYALACALWLTLSSGADAQTILYQGGEQPDFTCTGTCTTAAGAANFRAVYARMGIQVLSSAGDPPTNRLTAPAFAGASTLWVHFELIGSATTTTSGVQLLRLIDSAGNASLIVRGTGTANQLKISSRTAAGVFTDLVTCTLVTANLSALAQYDIKIIYSSTGGGEATLYQNSVSQCSFSGATTNGDGATTLTQIVLGSYGSSPIFSEVIASGSDTRTMARFTLNTATSGNATAWTNSSGTTPCSTAILAQNAINDANFVNTGSSGTIEQCVPNTSFPAGTWNVLALGLSARGLIGAGGPQNLSFMTRESGTDYTLTPTIPFTTTFSNVSNFLQATDPAGGAWAVSTFTTAGFNIGFKSAP